MEKTAQILQEMRNLIEESKRVPLTYDVLIDKREMVHLLDRLEEELLRVDKEGK